MHVTLALLGFLSLFTSILAVPATKSHLPWPEMEWTYTGTWGGREVNLTGTVQEQMSQMKAIDPDFDPLHGASNSSLDSRASLNKDGIQCCNDPDHPIPGQPWRRAFVGWIKGGISYLQKRDLCIAPAHTCIRISCDLSSGIWLCNDNDYEIQPKCDYIASYAQDLLDHCSNGPRDIDTVCGQEFDSDHYNVPVHQGDC